VGKIALPNINIDYLDVLLLLVKIFQSSINGFVGIWGAILLFFVKKYAHTSHTFEISVHKVL